MLIGLDLLGLGSKYWKVKETVTAIPDSGIAIGFFGDETFGQLAIANAKRLMDSGKVKAIRVQLHWDYGHKIIPIAKLERLLPKYEALARAYPSIPVYLSHSCEYTGASLAEVKARIDRVIAMAPSCIPVQTPMKAPVLPGYIVEVHGKQIPKAGQIGSTDGEAIFNMDAEKWVKGGSDAIILFAWGERCNLAEAHNTTPAPQRTAGPDRKYLKGLLAHFDPKGEPPAIPINAVPFKKPRLYKNFAEDNPGESKRDNRPLIIVPEKASHAEVLTVDGVKLGIMPYFGGYPGNLHRYYSGLAGGISLYGYELAELAKLKSGSPFIYFKVNKKLFGPVHGSFRQGYFQD